MFQKNNAVYCNFVLTVVFEGKRKKHPEVVSVVFANCCNFSAINLDCFSVRFIQDTLSLHGRLLKTVNKTMCVCGTFSYSHCGDLCVVTT